MLPFTYQHFRGSERDVGNDGLNDVQFAASCDGIHWMRYGRKPTIARGLPGEPDGGVVAATRCHICKGNYLHQCYPAWAWTHGGFRRLSRQQRQDKVNRGRQHYGVAIERRDGVASA
jgi:hypothetical protein